MSTIVCSPVLTHPACLAPGEVQRPECPAVSRPVARGWLPFAGAFDFRLRHFFICSAIIALLGWLDGYFVFRYQACILYTEENPICLYLIQWDAEGLFYFWVGKLIGTVSALLCMYGVYCWREHLGAIVVQAITLFQVGLITYQLVM